MIISGDRRMKKGQKMLEKKPQIVLIPDFSKKD